MKQLLIILLWLTGITVSAQRINRDFYDVSLSEALKYIQEQTANYDITFIYDELEDFRVTTHVQRKSVLDAIIQLVGFYPVRVVKRGEREIYVECTHKTERHLTGTIIDENRQPVPYANVYLLAFLSFPMSNLPFLPVSHTWATRPSIAYVTMNRLGSFR